MRECVGCEYLRTVNDPRSFTSFCIKHWKQVLLTGICPEFKHAEPFPYTEVSRSEMKAYWGWKQRKQLDPSALISQI